MICEKMIFGGKEYSSLDDYVFNGDGLFDPLIKDKAGALRRRLDKGLGEWSTVGMQPFPKNNSEWVAICDESYSNIADASKRSDYTDNTIKQRMSYGWPEYLWLTDERKMILNKLDCNIPDVEKFSIELDGGIIVDNAFDFAQYEYGCSATAAKLFSKYFANAYIYATKRMERKLGRGKANKEMHDAYFYEILNRIGTAMFISKSRSYHEVAVKIALLEIGVLFKQNARFKDFLIDCPNEAADYEADFIIIDVFSEERFIIEVDGYQHFTLDCHCRTKENAIQKFLKQVMADTIKMSIVDCPTLRIRTEDKAGTNLVDAYSKIIHAYLDTDPRERDKIIHPFLNENEYFFDRLMTLFHIYVDMSLGETLSAPIGFGKSRSKETFYHGKLYTSEESIRQDKDANPYNIDEKVFSNRLHRARHEKGLSGEAAIEWTLSFPNPGYRKGNVRMPDGRVFSNRREACKFYGISERVVTRLEKNGLTTEDAISGAIKRKEVKQNRLEDATARKCPVSGYGIMYADLMAPNRSLCIIGPDGIEYHSLSAMANAYGISADSVRYWMRKKGLSLNEAVLALVEKKHRKTKAA